MSRECDLDSTVTEFLLDTCQPCPPSRYNVHAALVCGMITAPFDGECSITAIPTGSVPEFCIEPMLPYIGDIDVMWHRNDQLAIPRGHPPPTQLPAEFHSYVHVYEIVDSHVPGYVYLPIRYLLSQCSNDDNYNAVEYYDREKYLQNDRSKHSYGFHGPALFLHPRDESLGLSDQDLVRCVRCLSWPAQAADWRTRHKNYGWPDSATLDRVVSNGCDVVGVAHRQCRQHEWIFQAQWRLSFSRAEIVLINSWMPIQQTVYHMLRYFTKTERLTENADNIAAGPLSNYHIKTLMLWCCEMKSGNWWTDDVKLVRICVHLLHILGEWLTHPHPRCPHYFIDKCNLIDNSFNMANVADQLMKIDKTWLSAWFTDNYVRKCLQLNDCPQNVSRLFADATSSMELKNALVAWKQKRSLVNR